MGWVLSNMGWVGVCQIWGQDLSQMGGTEGRNWFFGICQIWVGFCQIWVGSGFVKYGRRICHIWGARRVGIGTLGFVKYGLGFVKYGAPTLVE